MTTGAHKPLAGFDLGRIHKPDAACAVQYTSDRRRAASPMVARSSGRARCWVLGHIGQMIQAESGPYSLCRCRTGSPWSDGAFFADRAGGEFCFSGAL